MNGHAELARSINICVYHSWKHKMGKYFKKICNCLSYSKHIEMTNTNKLYQADNDTSGCYSCFYPCLSELVCCIRHCLCLSSLYVCCMTNNCKSFQNIFSFICSLMQCHIGIVIVSESVCTRFCVSKNNKHKFGYIGILLLWILPDLPDCKYNRR